LSQPQTAVLSAKIIPWRVGQEQRFLQVQSRGAAPCYVPQSDRGMLDALSLRTLRGFQWVKALSRGLDFALGMGSEITPPKDPLRRWISIDLAILAVVMLHDVPTPCAGLDNGTTGSPIEATARLFHKDAVRTRFNGDTFHRCARSFLLDDGHRRRLYQAAALSPGEALHSQSSAEESLSL